MAFAQNQSAFDQKSVAAVSEHDTQLNTVRELVKVFNLSDLSELHYMDMTPRTALLCAHAQYGLGKGMSDLAWDCYEERYGHLIERGSRTAAIGDLAVLVLPVVSLR